MADWNEKLPPPPPVPANVIPIKVSKLNVFPARSNRVLRAPMSRQGLGSNGEKLPLLTNHFKAGLTSSSGYFYQYNVALSYVDNFPANVKDIGREVLDMVEQTYGSPFDDNGFAYDGEKSLFTVGLLSALMQQYVVEILDNRLSNRKASGGSPGGNGSPSESDRKRMRCPFQSTKYKVSITYATKIPIQAIMNAINGQESHQFQEAVRVLDISLRQHAANRGCLLVRQSFFYDEPRNFVPLGGGVLGCRGFHSSFRPTQGGLSLNMDTSTTMIVQPGPVIDFLLANQNVSNPYEIDWAKAKRVLKNLRVKVDNKEYKISGLSDKICKEQTFLWKQKTGDSDVKRIELTIYQYFVEYRGRVLLSSADFPCINVGKAFYPVFYPIELCHLVSLQRYTKALSNLQRASLVEKSRQKPKERMTALTDAFIRSNYAAAPFLGSAGISVGTEFTPVEGRILSAPKLKVGNGGVFFPSNGSWNFNNKSLVEPTKIERWVVVNFSACCDIRSLCDDLLLCGKAKGIVIHPPFDVLEESQQDRCNPTPARVDKMLDIIMSRLPGKPQFILCILPEKKNSDIYGPWKRMCLAQLGVVTQCIAPTRVDDQYLTNVLLKINAKMGGMNSLLSIEASRSIPLVSNVPTVLIGMDVSHGSPGCSDVPSIAAVVSSRQWPLISRYRASVRTQSPKVEIIDNLFKKVSDTEDQGMFREVLMDFYRSSDRRKPENIIIFRDGVGESQFSKVLNIELDQIIEACNFLDDTWCPKFTFVVAQKKHHTRFFKKNSDDNVPSGTIIDNEVCHPKLNDFYMCAHASPIGTTRPTRYIVLHDEVGFSADDMQELVHSLSYVYQRSTTAISVVAPIRYAHLAAAQARQFIKLEDMSDTTAKCASYDDMSDSTASDSEGSLGGSFSPVPELPRLHKDIQSSMFFC